MHTTHAPVVASHNDAGREALTSPAQAQNSDEVIHVILAVYDPSGSYSQHAGVVMASIFENTKSKVVVHVLHDDTLTDDNRQKFIRTAEKYSQGLELHDVTSYKNEIVSRKINFPKRLSVGTLYRSAIPEIMPELDKVIYLDCDIVVNLDIRELWEISFDGKSLLASMEGNMAKTSPYSFLSARAKLAGANPKEYICAGVLVMNLKKIREVCCLSEAVIKWLARYGYLNYTADQGALNAIFNGDIKIIDGRFDDYSLKEQMPDTIIHCAWIDKPWLVATGSAADSLYWKAYIRSAWGENMTKDDIIDKMASLVSPSRHFHKHGRQCLNRLLNSVKIRFMWLCQPVRIIALLAKDMMFRIKFKFSRA